MDNKKHSLYIKGKGIDFSRTRRITGYLVGDLSRFNSAKYAEQRDRVKHGLNRDKED